MKNPDEMFNFTAKNLNSTVFFKILYNPLKELSVLGQTAHITHTHNNLLLQLLVYILTKKKL